MTLRTTLFIALLATTGCGAFDDPGSQILDPLALTGDTATGGSVYSGTCAGCHGPGGEGHTEHAPEAVDLTERIPEITDQQLVNIMVWGMGEMPAIDLSSQEMADVLAFLRHAFGEYEGHDDHDHDHDHDGDHDEARNAVRGAP